MSSVDVLYLAWNRREFTEHSFGWLARNTNWNLVQKLIVYDDGSTDGTLEYLQDAIVGVPVESELRQTDLKSPPAIMNHYVTRSDAAMFAKVDSDIVMPPGWLEALMGVMESHPDVELLGTEAGRIRTPEDGETDYGFEPGSHTGGVGLFRTSAFNKRRPLEEDGRFGFTEWQTLYEPVRGWITPDLLVSSLDQVPVEPWMTLSAQYVALGWQRKWPKYHVVHTRPYWGWWQNA